jgi:hypothetical protein
MNMRNVNWPDQSAISPGFMAGKLSSSCDLSVLGPTYQWTSDFSYIEFYQQSWIFWRSCNKKVKLIVINWDTKRFVWCFFFHFSLFDRCFSSDISRNYMLSIEPLKSVRHHITACPTYWSKHGCFQLLPNPRCHSLSQGTTCSSNMCILGITVAVGKISLWIFMSGWLCTYPSLLFVIIDVMAVLKMSKLETLL